MNAGCTKKSALEMAVLQKLNKFKYVYASEGEQYTNLRGSVKNKKVDLLLDFFFNPEDFQEMRVGDIFPIQAVNVNELMDEDRLGEKGVASLSIYLSKSTKLKRKKPYKQYKKTIYRLNDSSTEIGFIEITAVQGKKIKATFDCDVTNIEESHAIGMKSPYSDAIVLDFIESRDQNLEVPIKLKGNLDFTRE